MVRWLIILLWVCTAARAQEAGQALAVEVGVATRVAHERSLAADGVVTARELAALAQAKRNAARAGKLVQERAVSVSDSEQSASAQREAQAVLDGAVAARAWTAPPRWSRRAAR